RTRRTATRAPSPRRASAARRARGRPASGATRSPRPRRRPRRRGRPRGPWTNASSSSVALRVRPRPGARTPSINRRGVCSAVRGPTQEWAPTTVPRVGRALLRADLDAGGTDAQRVLGFETLLRTHAQVGAVAAVHVLDGHRLIGREEERVTPREPRV